ncbi:MAG: hypothetical protein ACRER5_16165 [Pseudomonas sp.]
MAQNKSPLMNQPVDEFDMTVSLAHAEAAGWDVTRYNGSNPFLSHFLYVCDFRRSSVELFSITKADFNSLQLDAEAADLATAVAHLLPRYAAGELTEEMDGALAPTLFGYVKATRSYSMWVNSVPAGARLHTVLHIYPTGGDNAAVRPFMPNAKGTMLTVDELTQLSNYVLTVDRQAHPEWFPG